MRRFDQLDVGQVFAFVTDNASDDSGNVLKKTSATTASYFAAFGKHRMFFQDKRTEIEPDEIVQPLAFELPIEV